ncbi:MAG: terpene cyclase/mutase family protein [Lentisphaerae bacterium]|nr:terpene cyclase/mutase family protein [Lentisphaerota bacterium]
MTRNNFKKNDDLELPGYEDVLTLLRSAPETKWRDISGDVMVKIKRRKAVNTFVLRFAVAAVFIIVIGTPFFIHFSSFTQSGAEEQKVEVAESRMQSTLEFLIASQEIDGMWSPERWGGSAQYATAVTGIAMMSLASLDDANLDNSAALAAAALRASQTTGGNFASVSSEASLLNHAVATVAMLQIYSTGRFPELFTVLDGAVNYIRSRQNAAGGWSEGYGASLWLAHALSLASDAGWQDKGG